MEKHLLILSLVLILIPANSDAETTLHLATGEKGGFYSALGRGIEKAVEDANPGINVILQFTKGSVENAKLIDNESVELAIIQNDIAHCYWKGERMFKFPSGKMQGIAALYTEIIHIIARKELNIENIADLRNKIIAVGQKNSGTEFNSSAILSAAGIKENNITKMFLSSEATKNSLIKGTIDAAFITSGLPTRIVTEPGKKINLIPIESKTIIKLRKSYPFFVATKIPANSYEGQFSDIFAIGVRALLVAPASLDPDIVEQVTKAIFVNNAKILNEAHSGAFKIELKNSTKGMTIPFHSGVENYYQKANLRKLNIRNYLPQVIYILISILLFTCIMLWRKNLKKTFKKNIYVKLTLVVLVFFFVGSIGAHFFEKDVNENFSTIYKTLWTTTVYVVSGFEDFAPITTGGKIFSLLIFIGNMGILGSIVGKFASIFINKGVEKMPRSINSHIAICNWNKKGDTIIKELHHPTADPDTEIIVLTDSDFNELELRKDSDRYANVYFIKGNPTFYETLESARIHLAKSVIILSKKECDDPDPLTILTCLAITKVYNEHKKSCRKSDNKAGLPNTGDEASGYSEKPHIIAELMDGRNREIALDAGADEVVSAGFYRTGIMLQSALYHNLSDIFHELFTYEADKASIYILSEKYLQEKIAGKTFQEVSNALNNNRDNKNPVILIGVRRNKKVILNPKCGTDTSDEKNFAKLQKGDALVVLSFKRPDLSKLDVN